MNRNFKLPKISIITPSYNQGQFIKRTIDSVLSQNYPNLEYIVVDGGSTDNTINVLRSYGKNLKWISEKDNGQTDAINKGIKMASGEIIAYLNSDDTYEPNALNFVGRFFSKHSEVLFLQGTGKMIDEKDNYIKNYHNKPSNFKSLYNSCDLCQPACFWRRKMMDKIGFFNTDFDYAMDYEYWIRASYNGIDLHYENRHLANSRVHSKSKTSSLTKNVLKNIFQINKIYYSSISEHWILNYSLLTFSQNKNNNLFSKMFFLPRLEAECQKNNFIFNHRIFSFWLAYNYVKWYFVWVFDVFKKIIVIINFKDDKK